jgi:GT2 family glycosyltransferase
VAYRIIDIELTEPLPEIGEAFQDEGLAIIIRFKGQLAGFTMVSAPKIRSGAELARLVSAEASLNLMAVKIAAEMTPEVAPSVMPALTVAICTRNRPELLARCLTSIGRLLRPDNPDGGHLELLVVDNAPSGDSTLHVTQRFSGVRYVREARPGLDFARNRALHEASGEIIAFLDDDVVVDHRWLIGIQAVLADHPDAVAVTGQVLPLELAHEAQIIFERRGGFRHGFSRRRYGPETDHGEELYPCRTGIFGVGCNMAFRRKALLDLGGFDEALDTGPPLPGGGDHDVFYRVVRSGGVLVYDPQMLVFHQHRHTMKRLRHQYWTWGLSVMAVAAKWYQSDPQMRQRWRLLIIRWFETQIVDLLRAVVRRQSTPLSCLLPEVLGGLVGLLGEYGRSCRRIEIIRRRHS